MRLAIITPAGRTAFTDICGAIMRQFCDTFMKKLAIKTGLQQPFMTT
jgi:hypothetical protein